MSLLAWQRALVELIGTGEVAPRRLAGLHESEADWFRSVAGSRGTLVTRAVAASWRAERVSRSAPLTLLALAALGERPATLAAYHRETTARSSYLVTEGLLFVDFVEGRGPDHPHLKAMVALDRAILLARATPWRRSARSGASNDWVDQAPGGAVVPVAAEPRSLLLALVGQRPLPEPHRGHGAFLVGPGIEGRFREASAIEARIHAAAAAGCRVADVVQQPGDEEVVDHLVEVGVLTRRTGSPWTAGRGHVGGRTARRGCEGLAR